MGPYDDGKPGPRRVLDGIGPLLDGEVRRRITSLRRSVGLLAFLAQLGVSSVRDEVSAALKKPETPEFHLQDPKFVLNKINERNQIEGLPNEIWIHMITGVRNGLQDHLLQDIFANPEMILNGVEGAFGENHRRMEVNTHVSRWARDNPSTWDPFAEIPGIAIVTDFAEIHMDEEYQATVVGKEVEKIEEAMLTQDFLILSAHSQGNNLLIRAFEELEKRGTLAAFRQKGGKVLFLGLAPAYSGVGPKFLQSINDLVGAQYEFLMDPKRVEHVLQELCDFGVILRGEGDILAGPVDLPEDIVRQDDDNRVAVGLNREFKTSRLKRLLTFGIAPHADVWTRPELQELIKLAVEVIYMGQEKEMAQAAK